MSFETSWQEADTTIFTALVKGTLSTAKQNAWEGHRPPVLVGWAYNSGNGLQLESTWPANVTALHFGATIDYQFLTLEDAKLFTMRLIKTCAGLTGQGNVRLFRIRDGGLAEPAEAWVPVVNHDEPVHVITGKILCELVFATGGSTTA